MEGSGVKILTFLIIAVISWMNCEAALSKPCSVESPPGYQRVDCSNRGIGSLDGILSEYKGASSLHFTSNILEKLDNDTFVGFSRLKDLYLDKNVLQEISVNSFNGLDQLNTLSLSTNILKTIPFGALSYLSSLRTLHLSNNPLISISTDPSVSLPKLNTLVLRQSRLRQIDPEFFTAFPNLINLDLSDNELTSLQFNPEDGCRLKLENLNLAKNNWRCDCHSSKLKLWLTYLPTLRDGFDLIECSSPVRNNWMKLMSLTEDKLSCEPEVQHTSKLLDIPEDSNTTSKSDSVVVKCSACGYPIPDLQFSTGEAGNFTDVMNMTSYNESNFAKLPVKCVTKVVSFLPEWIGLKAVVCVASNAGGTDEKSFSVNGTKVLQAVLPNANPTYVSTNETDSDDTVPSQRETLSSNTSVVIGIVVGLVLVLIVVAIVIFCCVRRHRRKRSNSIEIPSSSDDTSSRKIRLTRPTQRKLTTDELVDLFSSPELEANRKPVLNIYNRDPDSGVPSTAESKDTLSHWSADRHRRSTSGTKASVDSLQDDVFTQPIFELSSSANQSGSNSEAEEQERLLTDDTDGLPSNPRASSAPDVCIVSPNNSVPSCAHPPGSSHPPFVTNPASWESPVKFPSRTNGYVQLPENLAHAQNSEEEPIKSEEAQVPQVCSVSPNIWNYEPVRTVSPQVKRPGITGTHPPPKPKRQLSKPDIIEDSNASPKVMAMAEYV